MVEQIRAIRNTTWFKLDYLSTWPAFQLLCERREPYRGVSAVCEMEDETIDAYAEIHWHFNVLALSLVCVSLALSPTVVRWENIGILALASHWPCTLAASDGLTQ